MRLALRGMMRLGQIGSMLQRETVASLGVPRGRSKESDFGRCLGVFGVKDHRVCQSRGDRCGAARRWTQGQAREDARGAGEEMQGPRGAGEEMQGRSAGEKVEVSSQLLCAARDGPWMDAHAAVRNHSFPAIAQEPLGVKAARAFGQFDSCGAFILLARPLDGARRSKSRCATDRTDRGQHDEQAGSALVHEQASTARDMP